MFVARNAAITAIALSWLVSASASAWAAGGHIEDASGNVFVSVGKSAAHRAVKNDTFASDTMVVTGDNSHAVLQFEDGQVAVMQANTTFLVREYRYEPKQVEKSNIVFSMLKGGMRFITGLIGQNNKSAFRLSTPNATIGIRGTDFMVVMGNSPMYSQVVLGSIGMTNAAGTVAFSAGETAVVASATTLPAAISAAALPAGTFTQLEAIPVPNAPAGGEATGGASGGSAGATTGATTGISTTAIAIGAGVAAIAAGLSNTTTTTHHP